MVRISLLMQGNTRFARTPPHGCRGELAPFLLTNLLLDQLRAGARSRIVTLASATHAQGRIDFSDLQHERQYHVQGYPVAGWQAYCNTKLMNVLFTHELARRLHGSGVTANCLHPGVILTDLTRSWPAWAQSLYKLLMPGPARGARGSIFLASSPKVATISGQYFDQHSRVAEPAPLACNAALARQLWDVSAELVGLDVPATAAAPVLA